jgi:tetratricopeptide (TPR) repeat protein
MPWLIEQNAWEAVDELSQKFATRFNTEPTLLYLLAEAAAKRGQTDRAEETAMRAFRLHAEKQPEQLNRHYIAALDLRRRGLFAWARRELEYVIANAPVNEEGLLPSLLADMLHDQGEDRDAAKALQDMVESLAKSKKLDADALSQFSKRIEARINFYLACHWEQQNDPVKHRECLDKALPDGEDDVDILIACYRLPEQSPEYHAKIVDLIKKHLSRCRDQIAEEPEEDFIYNEAAWLVGNTEGDLDEALRFSEKSIELKPETGGYYDTLGRVYFARGELDNAVKNQTRALELEPHSGLIANQLKLFRKAMEEKGKKP